MKLEGRPLDWLKDKVVTLDAGCAERSCACYSPQFGDTGGIPHYSETVVKELAAELEYLSNRTPLTIQQIYDLLEVADPTETLQNDPHGTWEIVEFVRQIEMYYGIQREGDLYRDWREWKKS